MEVKNDCVMIFTSSMLKPLATRQLLHDASCDPLKEEQRFAWAAREVQGKASG